MTFLNRESQFLTGRAESLAPHLKLNRLNSIGPQLIASALALVAGGITTALLRLEVLPAGVPEFIHSSAVNQFVVFSRYPLASEISILMFYTAIGLALQTWGARRIGLFLTCGFGALIAVPLIASHLFSVTLPVVALLFGTAVTTLLVQVNRLWEVDRRLTRTLIDTTRVSQCTKTSDVSVRLNSGLRLLKTVLPLNEAVVFRYASDETFQVVARLRSANNTQKDNRSNSLWRDGVKLCEQATRKREVTIHSSEVGPVNVVVPLRHEHETVGALLLRLTTEFCEDDRPLLEAVGSQFARNLKRHNFSTSPSGNNLLGFFSQTASRKNLDALNVLKALLTEQRCEATTLREFDDGIAIAHLDGTLALTNSTLLSLVGLSAEQSETLDLFSLLHNLRTGVFDEPAIAVRRVLQTGIDYESELGFPEKGQTLGLRISLLRANENGNSRNVPIGLAIYVRDLTRIKEYEKLKSDMISLMSHELRTPLTSINGFAELLTTDETISNQVREFVTIIASESQRMSRMINTFLAVTQLQRKDKQEVLKIPLRLDEVVRETITTLQPVAKKKRIRLVEQVAHRVPPVAADKGLITQAVKNLVHNAIKYSPERTTVTVSTALEAETVRVCVEDRGFGIPSESKDRVWEKFYRVVREGREKDDESTGLGLSFVREVVEQHGGNVELESEEGHGSKFSFRLPRL